MVEHFQYTFQSELSTCMITISQLEIDFNINIWFYIFLYLIFKYLKFQTFF